MARSAATSCPRSCRLSKAAARRCARPSASSRPEGEADEQADGDVEGQLRGVLELDAAAIVTRDSGREGWLREGKRQLDVHRGPHPRPVPRARAARWVQAERRMVEELAVERVANDAYEAYRARGLDKRGWRLSSNPPKPYPPPRMSRPASSTRPTRTRTTCRRRMAGCRDTTRRPRSTSNRSFSAPR